MIVGIIGNGFVGGATYHTFSSKFDTRVYDKDESRSPNTWDEVMESDVVFVCVPTPMKSSDSSIDLSIVDAVFDRIEDHGTRDGQVFVIKSTVVPGTTKQYQDRGLCVVFSPEFLTERNAIKDSICSNHAIVGGEMNGCLKVVKLFKERFGEGYNVVATDSNTAEFIKYMRNAYFATKVTYMNEMFRLACNMGVDWETAVSGFSLDGRIGNSHLSVPGHDGNYGYGGTCFPKDVNAIIERSIQLGWEPPLLSTVREANIKYRGVEDWLEDEGRAVSTEG